MAEKKHWFNNGKQEKCCFVTEKPKNWVMGRLPISEETKNKLSISCKEAVSKLSADDRRKKYGSNWLREISESEYENWRKSVSSGRKGKGIGQIPWNKGKHVSQPAWNKGVRMEDKHKEKLRNAYKMLPDAEKERRRKIISSCNKGKIPWNKGKKCPIAEDILKIRKEKEYNSKRQNNSFNSSIVEENFYKALIEIYGVDDIKRQYSSDVYPFACDFYIISEDKYIELNCTWTHGGKPFNDNDKDCLEKLKIWQEHAKTSDYYKNAIYTWTDLDVRKQKIAKDKNLNYEVIYSVK